MPIPLSCYYYNIKSYGVKFNVPPSVGRIAANEIVRQALTIGFPFSPGVMTPSDIEGALRFGIHVLKLFPAGAAGGVKMLNSIAAPYEHLGVRFIPTGGVNQDNMSDYLQQTNVLAIGGTWVATREDIAAGRWNTIRNKCRVAASIVEELKPRRGAIRMIKQ